MFLLDFRGSNIKYLGLTFLARVARTLALRCWIRISPWCPWASWEQRHIQLQGPDPFPEFPGFHEVWFLMKKVIVKIPEISRQAVNMRTDVQLFSLKFILKQSTEYVKNGKEIFLIMMNSEGYHPHARHLGNFVRGCAAHRWWEDQTNYENVRILPY